MIKLMSNYLGTHIIAIDASNADRLFHCIAPEWIAKFLMEHHLNKSCDPIIHLRINGFGQLIPSFIHAVDSHAVNTA